MQSPPPVNVTNTRASEGRASPIRAKPGYILLSPEDQASAVEMIVGMLYEQPYADTILTRAAIELGMTGILQAGLAGHSRAPQEEVLFEFARILFARWQERAAERRRIQQVSRSIARLKAATPAATSSQASPIFAGARSWSQRDAELRALAQELPTDSSTSNRASIGVSTCTDEVTNSPSINLKMGVREGIRSQLTAQGTPSDPTRAFGITESDLTIVPLSQKLSSGPKQQLPELQMSTSEEQPSAFKSLECPSIQTLSEQKGEAAQIAAETKIDDPKWKTNMTSRWSSTPVAEDVELLMQTNYDPTRKKWRTLTFYSRQVAGQHAYNCCFRNLRERTLYARAIETLSFLELRYGDANAVGETWQDLRREFSRVINSCLTSGVDLMQMLVDLLRRAENEKTGHPQVASCVSKVINLTELHEDPILTMEILNLYLDGAMGDSSERWSADALEKSGTIPTKRLASNDPVSLAEKVLAEYVISEETLEPTLKATNYFNNRRHLGQVKEHYVKCLRNDEFQDRGDFAFAIFSTEHDRRRAAAVISKEWKECSILSIARYIQQSERPHREMGRWQIVSPAAVVAPVQPARPGHPHGGAGARARRDARRAHLQPQSQLELMPPIDDYDDDDLDDLYDEYADTQL